ncbi:MAG: hypothetical protein NVS9B10_25520 [Nevskia sp.]
MTGQHPQMVNGLYWVRGELEASLVRARAALEQHLELPDEAQPLQNAADELQVVRGTLGMIECFGAALFATEMNLLLASLREGNAAEHDESFSALSGATLQLSDYLDMLAHGEPDRAILLQTALNELRVARGQPLFTEAELFAAQAQAEGFALVLPDAGPPMVPGAAQAQARQELVAFQNAFLQWFRGVGAADALMRMGRIADGIAGQIGDAGLRTMWLAYAALAECLRNAAQTDSLDLKRLFGRAGSQLKLLADVGEEAAAAHAGDTAYLLLFQISRAPRQGERARHLLDQLGLAEVLPSVARLDDLRRRMRGPGSSILQRVYAEIRADFSGIKDGIDLAVRTSGRAPLDAAKTPERLNRLATTLSALGLPAPQQALINQARVLQSGTPDALTWMDVATAILRVEHSLEEALFRTIGRQGDAAKRPYAEIEIEVPHAQDLRNSVKALLRESLIDFAQIKSAVDSFLKDGDAAALADAPRLLHEVAAGLGVLSQERAAGLVYELERYVAGGALERAHAAHIGHERFADAVACVEVYLEALRDGLPNPGKIVDDLTSYIGRLDFTAVPEAAAAEAPAERGLAEPAPVAESQAAAEPPVAGEPPAPAPISAPVSAGIDPEMRDIFIEEAGEVLDELRRGLPLFRRDPGNREALSSVRRAFHTLKGSGRMVGALRIGEFGWAVENMLNRCLEGALPLRTPVFEVVGDAIDQLPGLIENFRGLGAESSAVADVIARATELAEGEPPAPEPDMRVVFCDDARERLGVVQRWLETQDPRDQEYEVEPEAIRAFHTLKGSAAVVNAVAISRLAAGIETYLNSLRLHGRRLPAPGLALLADAVQTLRSWVDALAHEALTDDDASDPWQARIDALEAPITVQDSALPAPPHVDAAFAMAALDALQALEAQAQAWAGQPGQSAHATALRAGFTQLAAAAAPAYCQTLTRLPQALAARVEPWCAAPSGPGSGFFATLLEIVEGLYQQLDLYREGGLNLAADAAPDAGTMEWLARIETLSRPPATAMPPVDAIAEARAFEPAGLADVEAFAAAPAIEVAEISSPVIEAPPLVTPSAPAAPDFDFATAIAEDPELLEIFISEAEEIIDSLQHHLGTWWRDASRNEALTELRRDLHTLKGSARTAGVHAMGTVAHRLEALLEGPVEPSRVATVQSQIETGLDGLLRQLDALRHHTMLAAESVIAAIDAVAARQGAPLVAGEAEFLSLLPTAPLEPAPADSASAGAAPTIGVSAPAESAAVAARGAAADSAAAIPGDEVRTGPVAEAAPADFQALDAELEAALAMPSAPAEPPAAVVEALPLAQAALAPVAEIAPAQAAASAMRFEVEDESALASSFDVELGDVFSAEATELLEALDSGFEAWQNGDLGEPVLEIQRALHTLKGGARMAGIEAMGQATHELESRVNSVVASGEFPDAATFEQLRVQLETLQRMHDQIRRGEAQLLAAPLPADELPSLPKPAVQPSTQWAPALFWRPDDEAGGYGAARRETARVPVDVLDTMLNEAGEISIYRSRLEEHNAGLRTQLNEMVQTVARVREQVRMMDIETEAQIAARGLAGSAPAGPDRYAHDFDPLEMDRYSRMQELSRALAESINDLSSLQATMDDAVSGAETLLQQQSRINTEVQQGLMGTLMVPFSRQVQRLLRVVRQTAQENRKQADLQFVGAEAELDRNVLERMTAPLEHLLRNAVVHGIEDPASRMAAGKSAAGVIQVQLKREGSQLLVEVSDDGAGLDFAAIRRKAIERNMIAPDAELSDDALARFIFEPGFSTAQRLTQDAGRGIGMDVVASEVKQLGGTLELRSEFGLGTRFLVRLPLTLAVSQALLVGLGLETYAVPLPSIEGIGRIPRAELAGYYLEDGPLYQYGGRGYRVHYLGDYLELPRPLTGESRTLTVILVRLGEGLTAQAERRVALVVDQLIGNREIISKAAGPQISAVPGVAGATILADGRVVLILDVPALVIEAARRALLAEATSRIESQVSDAVLETIMVVDDSITMRRVAERLLVRQGYRVVTAKDGLDAIALLQTELPSAVLLDIEMPRADGFEVAAFIRNNARLRDVPIIMITSRSGEKHRERARSLGVDRYLIKPYQEEQLLVEVNAVRGRLH